MYVEIWENNGGKNVFKDINQNEITERLLRYLDRTEGAALELLAVANFYDDDIFKLVISEFATGYPATKINELAKFSFISESNGRYYIQRLMRECLKNQLSNDPVTQTHQLLAEFYEDKLKDLYLKSASRRYVKFIEECFYHKRF